MGQQVFAYGSNMSSGRFRAYGVSPVGPGRPAVLPGYRLKFDKNSTDDGSGKANVAAQAGSEVWGVPYTVPGDDLSIALPDFPVFTNLISRTRHALEKLSIGVFLVRQTCAMEKLL